MNSSSFMDVINTMRATHEGHHTLPLTPEKILNAYRNFYFREPLTTEQGLIADALNDILPVYAALLVEKDSR